MKKVKVKHGWFFRLVMRVFGIFKKRPYIYNLNEADFETGIIVSNHSGASGPMTLALYFPTFFVPWGTHEMVGNYKERWNYLFYIFYQQKLGYKKFKSFILATLFAIISKMLYKGMGLIPTYMDLRLVRTIRTSVEHLEAGSKILIFPEVSDSGYFDEILEYNEGFVYLSQTYYKKHKVDLPIYPVYYYNRINAIIIGKKIYANKLLQEGLTRVEVAEHFKDVTNQLLNELVLKEEERLQKKVN